MAVGGEDRKNVSRADERDRVRNVVCQCGVTENLYDREEDSSNFHFFHFFINFFHFFCQL